MMPTLSLPWILLAGVGLFAGGVWYGSSNAGQACDLEAAEARGAATERFAQELTQATAASLAIADIGIELHRSFVVTRERTRTITAEVAHDVDAHPDLARCIVPAVTRRLRDEQVSESATIASGDRTMQR